MKIQTSIISSQGQVTMPINIRQQLGVKAGSVLLWEIASDRAGIPQVVVRAGTVKVLKKLKGVARRMYQQHGGGEAVLQKERATWEK